MFNFKHQVVSKILLSIRYYQILDIYLNSKDTMIVCLTNLALKTYNSYFAINL